MITVTTPSLCLTLPDRFEPGQSLSEIEAQVLERLRTTRLRYYLTSWLTSGMSAEQAQANLLSFSQTYTFTAKPPSEAHDPIQLEALRIAQEFVRKKLSTSGIELTDEALERHSAQVAKLPQVRQRAEEVIRLRKNAAEATLGR